CARDVYGRGLDFG
nr:immunoglobulin heavy chain junction region [Macaca mulatta]MOX68399.1 immunoglobulin heavy chain junction region [Macaca mulatta]